MKKILAILLAMMLVLAGCADAEEPSVEEEIPSVEEETPSTEEVPAEESLSVAILVPDVDDGSYFQAAVEGVKALEEKYPGTKTVAIDMGIMEAESPEAMPSAEEELEAYKDFFLDAAASGEYDLIVTAGAECNAAFLYAAEQYPDQLFFSCDLQTAPESVPANVYGLTYKVEDLGYLAGYFAYQVTTSDMELANEDKKVGVIVGMDFPGMNDYIGGFCQVCRDNGVTVYIDYPDGFWPDLIPIVVEQADAMYADGVDVIWQVAGAAGSGVFTSAAKNNAYAFGVDCDQTLTVADPAEVATIITSFYQDYAAAIENAFISVKDGTFVGGKVDMVGLKEGFTGYANNDQYKAMVPQEIQDAIAALYEEMSTGSIEIFKVSDDPEGWEELKAAVAP